MNDTGISADYIARRHKFAVVLLGRDGAATADRLATLLSHSGTVVLVQASEQYE